jgi:acid stress chaperone HdeB
VPPLFVWRRASAASFWTCGRTTGNLTFLFVEGERMKVLLAAAAMVVVGTLVSVGPASANIIDLSTWTCAKFRAADRDDIGIILAWLDGYYRKENDPAVIDTDKFVANAKKLGQYCAANPDVGLITATDKLFGK